MSKLFTDVGYHSLNKFGEVLCGDKVAVVEQEEGALAVLADGLGSGVKANILATLCSTIISTMLSSNMSIENCVATIASTLPVCSVRGLAYSTFTILRTNDEGYIEIIRYDNPQVIWVRDGAVQTYEEEELLIEERRIYRATLAIEEGDLFVAVSDGAPHAGVGKLLNFGWQLPEIAQFMSEISYGGFSAKAFSTILTDECNKLYGNQPGDDTTALVFRIQRKAPVNLLIGPPFDPEDDHKVMEAYFSRTGKHAICGGTTSKIAAEYLGKTVETDLSYIDPQLPPIAKVEGVDLVTEGIITISKVLEFAKDFLGENRLYHTWHNHRDGASKLASLLIEEASEIHFFVGKAVNPAHQNPNLPINFNIKMSLIGELSTCLKEMGKRVELQYF